MLGPGAVLVRDGEIVAVGDVDEEAKRTIDLGDATLLPGVIDLHVHFLGQGMLAGGVTTARDLGAPLSALPRPPPRPGRLRVLAAGPIVTAPGGYPIPVFGGFIALPVRGEAQARRAVRTLAERGAAVVKIALEPGPRGWPLLSVAEVRALVDEAHDRDLTVVAHARGEEGPRLALEAGVDELVHMPCGTTPEADVRELARRGIPVVATLHVQRPAGCLERARAFVDAGGELLYGTDFGNPRIPAGIDVEELRRMERAGLSRLDVLRAATSAAGEQLGLAPLGTLAPGAPADVVGVRGDPLADLGVLADPVLVVAGGHAVVAEGRIDLPPE